MGSVSFSFLGPILWDYQISVFNSSRFNSEIIAVDTEIENLHWNNAILQIWILNWANKKPPIQGSHIVTLVESKNISLLLQVTFSHLNNRLKILHWINYMLHFPVKWIFNLLFQSTFSSCCKLIFCLYVTASRKRGLGQNVVFWVYNCK